MVTVENAHDCKMVLLGVIFACKERNQMWEVERLDEVLRFINEKFPTETEWNDETDAPTSAE